MALWGGSLIVLTACTSSADQAPESIVLLEPTMTLAAEEIGPLPTPPPSLRPTAYPIQMPAFSLATPAPPTFTPPAISEPLEPSVTPQDTPAPTATLTPRPTFTPPALPGTSANEHYWLRRPVPEGGTIWTDKTYPYGSTRGDTLRPHHGVEFYVPSGTEVSAAASGTVIFAGDDSTQIHGPHIDFYGNLIIIELDSRLNGERVFNLYGHLSQALVSTGQRVEAEEIIALSGATGVADGSHLHFEVRVGQNDYASTRNPLLWLYPFRDHGTVAGRVTWPNGELAHKTPVYLRRIDAPSKYAETTTYANSDRLLNSDAGWGENFAFDDVVAGYYEVEVQDGDKKYKESVWVYSFRTSFIAIELE